MRKLSSSVRQRYRSQANRDSSKTFLSKDNLITLIRFYAGHECLWNQLNPDYHNSTKRNHLWSWIARQFGPKTSKSDVEWEILVLQKRALQEFERIQLYRGMGVKCNSTFDLLDEFQFLLDDVEEGTKPAAVEIQDSQHQTSPMYSDNAEANTIPDLDVFCRDLKEELSGFPPKIRLRTQQKILFIMHSARIKVDEMKAKPRKFVHWSI